MFSPGAEAPNNFVEPPEDCNRGTFPKKVSRAWGGSTVDFYWVVRSSRPRDLSLNGHFTALKRETQRMAGPIRIARTGPGKANCRSAWRTPWPYHRIPRQR